MRGMRGVCVVGGGVEWSEVRTTTKESIPSLGNQKTGSGASWKPVIMVRVNWKPVILVRVNWKPVVAVLALQCGGW